MRTIRKNWALSPLIALTILVTAGCGSRGDQLLLDVGTNNGEVNVGDVIEFKLIRWAHIGTAYRNYPVEEFEIQCDPKGAVQIDKANQTLTIAKSGKIRVWAEATLAPAPKHEKFVDWTSKEFKSNSICFSGE